MIPPREYAYHCNDPDHPTLTLQLNPQYSTKVDEEIADLILVMSNHGIRVERSCSNYYKTKDHSSFKNLINIEFHSHEDAKKFIDIVADFDDPMNSEQMVWYNRVMWNPINRELNENMDGFLYQINITDNNFVIEDNPEDFPPEELQEYNRPYPNVYFRVNLWFQRTYKDKVIDQFRKHDNLQNDPNKERIKFETATF